MQYNCMGTLLCDEHLHLRGCQTACLSFMSSRHSSQLAGWHRPGCLRQSSGVVPGGPCSGDGSGCGLPGGGAAVVLVAAAKLRLTASRRAVRLLVAPAKRAAAGLVVQSRRTKPRVTRHAGGS